MLYNKCVMKKRIIIFDLDGTLLNTIDDLAQSTNIVLKNFNYPQKTTDEIKSFVGNGVSKLIERAIPGGKDDVNFENCLMEFKKIYPKNMYNNTAPYPYISDMLKTLKFKGYKVAVVSNKFDIAVRELCDRFFPELIDFSAGENEAAGIRKKPAPDTVFKVLKSFDMSKEDAIYVGDSEVDIQTAKNSQIPCISVSWGFKDREFLTDNGACQIVDKPFEIIEILDNL